MTQSGKTQSNASPPVASDEWQWPRFTEEEAEAVKRVLLSNQVNYWTGEECKSFEREFAKWNGSTYAVAVANGTLALELALEALGIGPGDGVIVSPRTFLASASSIVRVGGYPVFADVDRDSQNISPQTIQAAIKPGCRAVMCVHLGGWPCDMPAIQDLAAQNDLAVIEDCAQAHGASIGERLVGSYGDAAAWSFCQDKIITTGGEGGMVTTSREDVWSKVWSYKDHGKNWELATNNSDTSSFRWVHETFGTNARMLEMQAAIGRLQLQRLEEWQGKRRKNAEEIWRRCRSIDGLRAPEIPATVTHAAYKCYVFVEPQTLRANWTRDRIVKEIRSLGVPCFSGSCSEIYLESAFENTGWRPERRLPVAQELGETSLMFLTHPTLSDVALESTCEAIRRTMSRAIL